MKPLCGFQRKGRLKLMQNELIKPAKKVVVLIKKNLASVTGSHIDAVSKDIPEVGEVVAIGKGVLPVDMKVGDLVAYRRYGESKFFISGRQVLFVHFDDILGTIKI
jgi:co-chaperonin GroES (HSP10)